MQIPSQVDLVPDLGRTLLREVFDRIREPPPVVLEVDRNPGCPVEALFEDPVAGWGVGRDRDALECRQRQGISSGENDTHFFTEGLISILPTRQSIACGCKY